MRNASIRDICILTGGMTRNVEVVGSSPIKDPRCFIEQVTLSLLLSAGWFQERILA